ncbi:hypothetical protein NL676_004807 [Syzygium grande]|nr:hypothetical protein NL676_004807 [Syzygium grande]
MPKLRAPHEGTSIGTMKLALKIKYLKIERPTYNLTLARAELYLSPQPADTRANIASLPWSEPDAVPPLVLLLARFTPTPGPTSLLNLPASPFLQVLDGDDPDEWCRPSRSGGAPTLVDP